MNDSVTTSPVVSRSFGVNHDVDDDDENILPVFSIEYNIVQLLHKVQTLIRDSHCTSSILKFK